MCLDTITAKNRNLSGKGWKVFKKLENGYSSSIWDGQLYNPNIWIKDEINSIRLGIFSRFGTYPTGFHIFKKKREADLWKYSDEVVKKVYYRRAHTYGTTELQRGSFIRAKTIVANEMKILS